MKKKFLLTLFVVVMVLTIFVGCSSKVSMAKVANGDMENYEASGATSNWEMVTNDTADGSMTEIKYISDNDMASDQGIEALGKKQVSISVGAKVSSAYLKQSVKFVKGKTYKLSGYIKASGSIEGEYSDSSYFGAHVGFLEDRDFRGLETKKKTENSSWQYYEAYFTAATSRALTLIVGIGHPDGKAKGTASFDAIKVEAVDPKGLEGITISTVKYGTNYTLSDAKSTTYIVFGCLIMLIGSYLLYYFIRKQMIKDDQPLLPNAKLWVRRLISPMALFIYTLLAAFLVRFIIVLSLQGQGIFTEYNGNLALKLTDFSWPSFFEKTSSNDPIGMLYILGSLGGFAELVNIQFGTVGMGVLLRLPMIIADIITCYLIFALASKYYKPTIAVSFAAMYALMPLAFTVSADWGNSISICACFMVATMSAMLHKKYISTSILMAFAILFDYIALIFAPIVVGYLIYYFVIERESRIKIGCSLAGSAVGFLLLSLPFCVTYIGKGDVFFFIKKMWAYFAEMSTITTDAFNFYAIFGLNGVTAPVALVVLNSIFIVGLAGLAICTFVRNRDRLSLLLAGSFVMIASGVLGAKAMISMTFLGVIMLFVYSVVSTEKRVTSVYIALSTMTFINAAQLSAQSGFLSGNPNMDYITFGRANPFIIVCSIITVALVVYLGYLVFEICFREKQVILQPTTKSMLAEIKGFTKRKLEAK